MSYLPPPFEHDIFISYAHVDDLPSPGKTEGWVTLFHKHLEIALSKRFGRIGRIEIWRDTEKVSGNTYFDEAIRSGIQKTGIFLALTSRGYLSPEGYCHRELEEFFNAAQKLSGGMKVQYHSRLFNILMQNISKEKLPQAFEGTTGFIFHDAEPQSKEIGQPLRHDGEIFEGRLHKLVDQIEATLRALQERSPVPNQAPQPKAMPEPDKSLTPEQSFTVFLAHTEGVLRSKRGRIIQELQQNGIRVVTDIPPPSTAKEHNASVTAAIKSADLSVHLLDEAPGLPIDGEPDKSYFQKQVEIGMESKARQLIWMPKSLEIQSIEDEPHKNFLDRIENGKREQAAYELVRETHGSIPREILAYIEKIKKEQEHPCPPNAPLAALLDTHMKDQVHAYDLSKVILGCKMQPYINPESDAPQNSMTIFQEMLKSVSVLIIIFGRVAGDWVHHRLFTAIQTHITEKCPLKFLGIYFAPVDGQSNGRKLDFGLLPVSLPIFFFYSPEDLAELLDAFIGGKK